MADGTKIEWTGATWNPIRARLLADTSKVGWHCEHVSPGCVYCYAERINQKRFGTGLPYKPGHLEDVEVYLDEAVLLQPLRWKKPRLIFPCSMTDLFGRFVTDEMLDRVFAVMALASQHTFQVLTKRSERMRDYLQSVEAKATRRTRIYALGSQMMGADEPKKREVPPAFPLPSVWLGVSVEDQARADERIPDLLATPAAVRWLSCEPLLGRVALPLAALGKAAIGPRLHWIVVGGESGPGARPMHPDWARSLRDQCEAAGVPFFFKQWGEWFPSQDGDRCVAIDGRNMPSLEPNGSNGDGTVRIRRAGKKRAGRALDGREYSAMPRCPGAA